MGDPAWQERYTEARNSRGEQCFAVVQAKATGERDLMPCVLAVDQYPAIMRLQRKEQMWQTCEVDRRFDRVVPGMQGRRCA